MSCDITNVVHSCLIFITRRREIKIEALRFWADFIEMTSEAIKFPNLNFDFHKT